MTRNESPATEADIERLQSEIRRLDQKFNQQITVAVAFGSPVLMLTLLSGFFVVVKLWTCPVSLCI